MVAELSKEMQYLWEIQPWQGEKITTSLAGKAVHLFPGFISCVLLSSGHTHYDYATLSGYDRGSADLLSGEKELISVGTFSMPGSFYIFFPFFLYS